MRRLTFVALAMVWLSQAPTSCPAQDSRPGTWNRRYFGLLVGVEEYYGPQLRPLRGIARSTEELEQALRWEPTSLPFVAMRTLVREVRVDQVRDALAALVARMTPGDVLIFYFNGHGGMREMPGMNEEHLALFTSDFGPENYFFPLLEFYRLRQGLRGCEVWFICDGCFAGPQTLTKAVIPDVTLSFLTATKDAELSYEVDFEGRTGGLFTLALLDTLRHPRCDFDGDGLISLEELHNVVYRRMLDYANRVGNRLQYPSLTGARVHRQFISRGYPPPDARFPFHEPTTTAAPSSSPFQLKFQDGPFPFGFLRKEEHLTINERTFTIDNLDRTETVLTLSSDVPGIRRGLVRIQHNKNAARLWCEGKRGDLYVLKQLRPPYPITGAHAVIVAIGNQYEKIGPAKISGAVASARKIEGALRALGFDYIKFLAEEDAKTDAVKEVLSRYVGPRPYDLKLIDWGDGSRVPAEGNDLVIVGTDTKDQLHIRVFDFKGQIVKERDEIQLPTAQSEALKKRLQELFPSSTLSGAVKRELVQKATALVGLEPEPPVLEPKCLVFYFQGHGFYDRAGTKRRYLWTADFDEQNTIRTGLDLGTITDLLRGSRAKHVLFVLDACSMGADNAATPEIKATPWLLSEEQTVDAALFRHFAESRCLITATSGNEAANPYNGSGVLSQSLLTALEGAGDKDSDGAITTQELHEYLVENIRAVTTRAEVKGEARAPQNPGIMWFSSSRTSDVRPQGQLVFLLPTPAAEP